VVFAVPCCLPVRLIVRVILPVGREQVVVTRRKKYRIAMKITVYLLLICSW
jgi:hypothetical protein